MAVKKCTMVTYFLSSKWRLRSGAMEWRPIQPTLRPTMDSTGELSHYRNGRNNMDIKFDKTTAAIRLIVLEDQ